MLFLTVLLSIFYFVLRILGFKKPNKLNAITCQVFGVVLFVFIIVCLLRNPFERFSTAPMEGIGLNPPFAKCMDGDSSPNCVFSIRVCGFGSSVNNSKYSEN